MAGAPLPDSTEPRPTQLVGSIVPISFADLEMSHQLGRGAYGIVHKALYKTLGIQVAVKVVDSPDQKQSFLNEAQKLVKLRHDNIIRLHGVAQDVDSGGRMGLVMDFAECGSLHSLLHEERHIKYTVAHAVDWILQATDAVAYIHRNRFLHRDLKPANLLLRSSYHRLIVCDFGTVAQQRTTMTSSRGSAAWMAPEVFSSSAYDAHCDVYSFGIIIWEVFSRRKPFIEYGDALSVMWRVYKGTRPPLLHNMPPALETLMKNCWHRQAAHRPTMAELYQCMKLLAKLYPRSDEPLIDTQTCKAIVTPRNTLSVGTPSSTVSSAAGIQSVISDESQFLVTNSRGHRRGGSYDANLATGTNPAKVNPSPSCSAASDSESSAAADPHRRCNSIGNDGSRNGNNPLAFLDHIDSRLRPLNPLPNDERSEELYASHLVQCREAFELDEKLRSTMARKHELIAQLQAVEEYKHKVAQLRQLEKLLVDAKQRIANGSPRSP